MDTNPACQDTLTGHTLLAMTPLQELIVNRMNELDLSFRAAEQRSMAGGRPLVSRATLNKIALGRHRGVFDDDTLHGIALALDLSQSVVRAAAGEPAGQTEFRLPKKANRLTAGERAAILKMVDALLDVHSEG